MSTLVDIVPGQLYILAGMGEDYPVFINWTQQRHDILVFVTSFKPWTDTVAIFSTTGSFKDRYILKCIDSTGEERTLPLFRTGSGLHIRFRYV